MTTSSTIDARRLLKATALWDGALGIVVVTVLMALADALAPVLGLPASFLRIAAAVLMLLVVVLLVLSRQRQPHVYAACSAVTLNALWVIGSVVLVAGGFYSITSWGLGVVMVLALGATVFMTLEYAAGVRLFGKQAVSV